MVVGYVPPRGVKRNLKYEAQCHLWDDPYLYRVCSDGLLWRRVPMVEAMKIIERCHASPYGGHYGAFHMYVKIWQSGFFWPMMYQDTKEFIRRCARC
jgi:hypothetical protein